MIPYNELVKLVEKVEDPIIKAQFLARTIPFRTKCIDCGNKVNLAARISRSSKNVHYNYSWRCTSSKCNATKSILNRSFFSLFRTPVPVLLAIIRLWSLQMSAIGTQELLQSTGYTISLGVIYTLFKRLRNICSYVNKQDEKKLGGPGQTVEIDETLVAKIKYNRGNGLKRKQLWMFGLVCRNDRKCHLEIVPNRKAETLLAIIYDRVEPETTINSDSWSSYRRIGEMQYNHRYGVIFDLIYI